MEKRGPQAFGQLLKRYRLAANLTQEALAERAGMSARCIGDLECGAHRAPRRDIFALLVVALDVSPCQRAALERTIERRRKPRLSHAVLQSQSPPSPPAALPHAGADVVALTRRAALDRRAVIGAAAAQRRGDGAMLAGRSLSREARAAWALQYLAINAEISPRAYVRATGVDRKTAWTDLGVLVKRGLVRASGATTNRRYALCRDDARTG